MTFEEFKALHHKYYGVKSEVDYSSEEYESYIDARYEHKEFHEWALVQSLKEKNFPYKDFCCVDMAQRIYESLDEKGEIEYDDVDVVMNKWDDETFGIPIHDGGTSIIEINFCPWCGKKLKKNA